MRRLFTGRPVCSCRLPTHPRWEQLSGRLCPTQTLAVGWQHRAKHGFVNISQQKPWSGKWRTSTRKSSLPRMSRVATTDPLREEVRNRLLRRADWRFFLTRPRPTKSICFANGLLGRAVRLISDCMADERLDPNGDCDLAVAVNPNLATMRKCWSALRPGGSCYTEWYSPFAGGPNGIQRRLESAGFEDVTCYWPWPWPVFSNPRYWLQLGAPGALHHFLLSRPPTLGIISLVANASLRAIWLICLRVGLTLPICAIAHKPALTANHHLPTASQVPPCDGRSSASGISHDLLNMIRD